MFRREAPKFVFSRDVLRGEALLSGGKTSTLGFWRGIIGGEAPKIGFSESNLRALLHKPFQQQSKQYKKHNILSVTQC